MLRSLSSTSTFASENRLFGFANNWQPPSSGFQPAAPVTPTVHSAAAKPVTASNHFQLVDGSQLVGKNPFSPNFSGRTQSLDGLREHKATEHNQQAHSAPVVPERPGISHFRFPSKKSIEFYLPRIQVGLGEYLPEFQPPRCSWERVGALAMMAVTVTRASKKQWQFCTHGYDHTFLYISLPSLHSA